MGAGPNRVPEYLRADFEHSLGDLALQVAFGLAAPWTILFGPSGAGKTGLLRVLAGLTKARRGRILLHGQTLLDTDTDTWVAPAKRHIGFVSQRPALFPHMDVTANVAFGLTGLTRAATAERVAAMLTLFEASHLATRMPANLSGGEKQRVAMARALSPEPRLLLLDEPFTAMDADLKSGILQRLTAWIGKTGIPALYVSHDIAEAFATEADVIVLEHGQIQAQGPARQVLADRRDRLLLKLGEP